VIVCCNVPLFSKRAEHQGEEKRAAASPPRRRRVAAAFLGGGAWEEIRGRLYRAPPARDPSLQGAIKGCRMQREEAGGGASGRERGATMMRGKNEKVRLHSCGERLDWRSEGHWTVIIPGFGPFGK